MKRPGADPGVARLGRRAFLGHGARAVARRGVEALEARARARAAGWVRPPFAVPELELLLACTRCGACVQACPHAVIVPLPARLGADVAGTPVLDLVRRGCHLCPDWPCVAACPEGVLERPGLPGAENDGASPVEGAPPAWPRLARARIDTTRCLPYLGPECGACAGTCPVPGALVFATERPRIDPQRCVGCALCREACPVDPKAVVLHPVERAP